MQNRNKTYKLVHAKEKNDAKSRQQVPDLDDCGSLEFKKHDDNRAVFFQQINTEPNGYH